jgi:transposase-like protein
MPDEPSITDLSAAARDALMATALDHLGESESDLWQRLEELANRPRMSYKTHKTCSRCKERKPHAEFGANRARADGMHPWCKACKREYRRDLASRKRESLPPT